MEKKPQEVSRSQATSCCVSGLQNRCVETLLLGHKPSVCESPLEESLEMFAYRLPVLTDSRSMGQRVVWWGKGAKPGIIVKIKISQIIISETPPRGQHYPYGEPLA